MTKSWLPRLSIFRREIDRCKREVVERRMLRLPFSFLPGAYTRAARAAPGPPRAPTR